MGLNLTLEWWIYPELDVYFTSVTDHWATATITGPNARKVIEKVCDDIDLCADALLLTESTDDTCNNLVAGSTDCSTDSGAEFGAELATIGAVAKVL